MAAIPSAGLSEAEVAKIQFRHPDLAAEIARLNERIVNGNSGSEDLTEFVRLLFRAGETARAEMILRAAIEKKEDGFYRLYSELFGGTPDTTLVEGIKDFQQRFGVFLFDPHPRGFLQIEYSVRVPKGSCLHRFSAFEDILIYTAIFSCNDSSALVTVDLQSKKNNDAVALDWNGKVWARVH